MTAITSSTWYRRIDEGVSSLTRGSRSEGAIELCTSLLQCVQPWNIGPAAISGAVMSYSGATRMGLRQLATSAAQFLVSALAAGQHHALSTGNVYVDAALASTVVALPSLIIATGKMMAPNRTYDGVLAARSGGA